jgi:hypothetical protein
MGFPTNDWQKHYSAIDYRLGLAIYGTCGYVLSVWLSSKYDRLVWNLASRESPLKQLPPPIFPEVTQTYVLAIVIFLFLLFAPKYGQAIPRSINRNSLSYGVFVAIVYFGLTLVSLFCFRINGGLIVQFIGYAFILASTEFLQGFEFDFSFAGNGSILREARIEKVRLLYRRWFSGVSALVTVSIAICITAAVNLFAMARTDAGKLAADKFGEHIAMLVVFAGIGLTLGPFARMFGILEKIENLLESIEAPVIQGLPKQRAKK